MGRSETLSAAQQRMLKLLENKDLARIVGATFAEVVVELADAKQEAAHWKRAFDTVRSELKCVVAIFMRKNADSRLVVTKAQMTQFNLENLELWCGAPEEGVRVYELRSKAIKGAIDTALGMPINGRPQ